MRDCVRVKLTREQRTHLEQAAAARATTVADVLREWIEDAHERETEDDRDER